MSCGWSSSSRNIHLAMFFMDAILRLEERLVLFMILPDINILTKNPNAKLFAVKQCLTQIEQEKKDHPVRMLSAPSRERQSND